MSCCNLQLPRGQVDKCYKILYLLVKWGKDGHQTRCLEDHILSAGFITFIVSHIPVIIHASHTLPQIFIICKIVEFKTCDTKRGQETSACCLVPVGVHVSRSLCFHAACVSCHTCMLLSLFRLRPLSSLFPRRIPKMPSRTKRDCTKGLV